MSERSSDRTSPPHESEQPAGEIRYPTDHVLGEHGAHTVASLGRFTITSVVPPKTA